MKLCIKCNILKDINLFNKHKATRDKLQKWCKDCYRQYKDANKGKVRLCSKCKCSTNRTGYCKRCQIEYEYSRKQEIQIIKREYFKEHKKQINVNNKNKYHNDIQFRLAYILRRRIQGAIKQKQKVGSAIFDLGCSIEEFKIYIEKQFQANMSWDNYGKWHLDHIKPLASFDLTDRKQFLQACNYTNYQPLWAEDNLRKSSKINWSR